MGLPALRLSALRSWVEFAIPRPHHTMLQPWLAIQRFRMSTYQDSEGRWRGAKCQRCCCRCRMLPRKLSTRPCCDPRPMIVRDLGTVTVRPAGLRRGRPRCCRTTSEEGACCWAPDLGGRGRAGPPPHARLKGDVRRSSGRASPAGLQGGIVLFHRKVSAFRKLCRFSTIQLTCLHNHAASSNHGRVSPRMPEFTITIAIGTSTPLSR